MQNCLLPEVAFFFCDQLKYAVGALDRDAEVTGVFPLYLAGHSVEVQEPLHFHHFLGFEVRQFLIIQHKVPSLKSERQIPDNPLGMLVIFFASNPPSLGVQHPQTSFI